MDREYRTQTLPARPLVRTLADGLVFAPRIHLVDGTDEAPVVLAHEPHR